jgi:hypothetical protein
MASFCTNCGAPLSGGPFCGGCGTDMRKVGTTSQPPLVAQTPATHPTQSTTPPVPAKQGMSTLAKLGIAALAIIFVGGAAGAVGVYYVAHKVSQRVHQAEDRILGSSSDSRAISHEEGSGSGGSESGRSAESGTVGDTCRLLSKEEVSRAVGVEIVATEPGENGCNYLANGTQADMTAKHITAMAKDKGADAQTQKMVQTFAGTLLNSFQEQHPNEHADQNGEVPVFVFSIDNRSAEVQMRLSAKTFGNLGPGPQGLPGIGDQAFDMGNAMIMVRKGDKLIRIAYMTCPCNTDAIKPLAKMLADRV